MDIRQRFLSGMSHAACTVNIVTTDGPAGRSGVTVSAMSSVSADTPKPTLLVCIHHQSITAPKVIENGVFCVNVLRDDQTYISDTFAGRLKSPIDDKFDCASWTTEVTGAPRVVDPLVAFDCRVVSSERVGTHHIFLGEVEDIFMAERGSPLIYANRAYGTPTRVDTAEIPEMDSSDHNQILRIGCFHTFGPYILPNLLSSMSQQEQLQLHLVEGDQRRICECLSSGEIDIALIYDFDLGEEFEYTVLAELEPYVLMSENSPLASHASLTAEQLKDEPMILLDAPPSTEYFSSLITDAGYEPNIQFRTRSFEMVRSMVGHGLGYALLVTKPASAMTYDGKALKIRPLKGKVTKSRMVLAQRKGLSLPPVAERFARLCYQFFYLAAAKIRS